jgi:hypothetical protein
MASSSAAPASNCTCGRARAPPISARISRRHIRAHKNISRARLILTPTFLSRPQPMLPRSSSPTSAAAAPPSSPPSVCVQCGRTRRRGRASGAR